MPRPTRKQSAVKDDDGDNSSEPPRRNGGRAELPVVAPKRLTSTRSSSRASSAKIVVSDDEASSSSLSPPHNLKSKRRLAVAAAPPPLAAAIKKTKTAVRTSTRAKRKRDSSNEPTPSSSPSESDDAAVKLPSRKKALAKKNPPPKRLARRRSSSSDDEEVEEEEEEPSLSESDSPELSSSSSTQQDQSEEEEEEDDDDDDERQTNGDTPMPLIPTMSETEFKIETVLLRKTQSLAKWHAETHGMNTSKLIHGSRWGATTRSVSSPPPSLPQQNPSSPTTTKTTTTTTVIPPISPRRGDVVPPDSPPEERFLIRWSGLSYLHCSWERKEDVLNTVDSSRKTSTSKRLSRAPESDLMYDGKGYNPDFVEIERIVAVDMGDAQREEEPMYLIKWFVLGYDEATWETASDIGKNDLFHVKLGEFQRRETTTPPPPSKKRTTTPSSMLTESPVFKNNRLLRDYQVEAVNWLRFNVEQHRNSILADEMGLGKTCQTVAFSEYMVLEKHMSPVLVVAPLATLPHWMREYETWTDLNTICYYGNAMARETIREHEFTRATTTTTSRGSGKPKFDVLVTNFETVISDIDVLKKFTWGLLVVDEAHRLKNRNSKLTIELRDNLKWDTTLLLTGTPIQNNTAELWTLLNFVDPTTFNSLAEFEVQFGHVQTAADMNSMHEVMKPYLLRRFKTDVEATLPPKTETLIEVELTTLQKKVYKGIYEQNMEYLLAGVSSNTRLSLNNVAMQLRKVCNHPYLIEGVEAKVLQDHPVQQADDGNDNHVQKYLVETSGKMILLDKLLNRLHDQGHRVLIFSQFVMMLDILEDYLQHKRIQFERIDGSVSARKRQEAIDRFSTPESRSLVFLLSTRGCGQGINLTAADTVIMFDSDWNPQNDIQAQARCHRIGQTRPVSIYRFITGKTYEQTMFTKASLKLGLDQAISSKLEREVLEHQREGSDSAIFPQQGMTDEELEHMLRFGAYAIMPGDEDESTIKNFSEATIDDILAKRGTVLTVNEQDGGGDSGGGSGGGTKRNKFSKATFVTSDGDDVNGTVVVDMQDPDFWYKVMGDAADAALAAKEARKNAFGKGKRNRRTINYGLDGSVKYLDEFGNVIKDSAEAAAAAAAVAAQLSDSLESESSSTTDPDELDLSLTGDSRGANSSEESDGGSHGGSDASVPAPKKRRGKKDTHNKGSNSMPYYGGAGGGVSVTALRSLVSALAAFAVGRWDYISRHVGKEKVMNEDMCAKFGLGFVLTCVVLSQPALKDTVTISSSDRKKRITSTANTLSSRASSPRPVVAGAEGSAGPEPAAVVVVENAENPPSTTTTTTTTTVLPPKEKLSKAIIRLSDLLIAVDDNQPLNLGEWKIHDVLARRLSRELKRGTFKLSSTFSSVPNLRDKCVALLTTFTDAIVLDDFWTTPNREIPVLKSTPPAGEWDIKDDDAALINALWRHGLERKRTLEKWAALFIDSDVPWTKSFVVGNVDGGTDVAANSTTPSIPAAAASVVDETNPQHPVDSNDNQPPAPLPPPAAAVSMNDGMVTIGGMQIRKDLVVDVKRLASRVSRFVEILNKQRDAVIPKAPRTRDDRTAKVQAPRKHRPKQPALVAFVGGESGSPWSKQEVEILEKSLTRWGMAPDFHVAVSSQVLGGPPTSWTTHQQVLPKRTEEELKMKSEEIVHALEKQIASGEKVPPSRKQIVNRVDMFGRVWSDPMRTIDTNTFVWVLGHTKLKYSCNLPLWWMPHHDVSLLRGMLRHGYGVWNEIFGDPELFQIPASVVSKTGGGANTETMGGDDDAPGSAGGGGGIIPNGKLLRERIEAYVKQLAITMCDKQSRAPGYVVENSSTFRQGQAYMVLPTEEAITKVVEDREYDQQLKLKRKIVTDERKVKGGNSSSGGFKTSSSSAGGGSQGWIQNRSPIGGGDRINRMGSFNSHHNHQQSSPIRMQSSSSSIGLGHPGDAYLMNPFRSQTGNVVGGGMPGVGARLGGMPVVPMVSRAYGPFGQHGNGLAGSLPHPASSGGGGVTLKQASITSFMHRNHGTSPHRSSVPANAELHPAVKPSIVAGRGWETQHSTKRLRDDEEVYVISESEGEESEHQSDFEHFSAPLNKMYLKAPSSTQNVGRNQGVSRSSAMGTHSSPGRDDDMSNSSSRSGDDDDDDDDNNSHHE